AEDGIRDYKVTGVQTCALPISLASLGGLTEHIQLVQGREAGVRQTRVVRRLPCPRGAPGPEDPQPRGHDRVRPAEVGRPELGGRDRKSTRLNSSHLVISYAGFC